jgi:hypothetical protein
MEFVKTQVEVFGITLMEPMAVATDILVSIVCLYSFIKLRKLNSTDHSLTLFSWYFLLLSIATACGGIIGHAFMNVLPFEWKIPGWIISMSSVTFLSLAVIQHAKPFISARLFSILRVIGLTELLLMIPLVLSTMNFFFVELHATFGLLAMVFSLELFLYLKTQQAESRLMIQAVGISSLAALVHLSGFTINRWFNHLDLSHLFMAFSAYLFFLGAKRLALKMQISPAKIQ